MKTLLVCLLMLVGCSIQFPDEAEKLEKLEILRSDIRFTRIETECLTEVTRTVQNSRIQVEIDKSPSVQLSCRNHKVSSKETCRDAVANLIDAYVLRCIIKKYESKL